jgi:hypothetical protein
MELCVKDWCYDMIFLVLEEIHSGVLTILLKPNIPSLYQWFPNFD